jgi:CheY-like chemotaxis protein
MRSYLIVDDNRALAENLAEIVRDLGDEALVAGSGAEALALLAGKRFDAVLTDMRMPVMDGAELVREVRRVDPGLPVIVITAFFRDAGLRAVESEGPLAVLPKPVPVAQLVHLLQVARRRGRLVLVEDDAVFAENLGEILRERGFSVVRVQAVGEIDGLAEDRPLLAVVDLRLPGAPDGEAVRRLAERYPGLPLLVATGYRDLVPPEGAVGLFVKPFDPGQLLEAIERVYERAAHA